MSFGTAIAFVIDRSCDRHRIACLSVETRLGSRDVRIRSDCWPQADTRLKRLDKVRKPTIAPEKEIPHLCSNPSCASQVLDVYSSLEWCASRSRRFQHAWIGVATRTPPTPAAVEACRALHELPFDGTVVIGECDATKRPSHLGEKVGSPGKRPQTYRARSARRNEVDRQAGPMRFAS